MCINTYMIYYTMLYHIIAYYTLLYIQYINNIMFIFYHTLCIKIIYIVLLYDLIISTQGCWCSGVSLKYTLVFYILVIRASTYQQTFGYMYQSAKPVKFWLPSNYDIVAKGVKISADQFSPQKNQHKKNAWFSPVFACFRVFLPVFCVLFPKISTGQKKQHQLVGTVGTFLQL